MYRIAESISRYFPGTTSLKHHILIKETDLINNNNPHRLCCKLSLLQNTEFEYNGRELCECSEEISTIIPEYKCNAKLR